MYAFVIIVHLLIHPPFLFLLRMRSGETDWKTQLKLPPKDHRKKTEVCFKRKSPLIKKNPNIFCYFSFIFYFLGCQKN